MELGDINRGSRRLQAQAEEPFGECGTGAGQSLSRRSGRERFVFGSGKRVEALASHASQMYYI